MRYLLDTCCIIYFLNGVGFTNKVADIIYNDSNELCISQETLRELAIQKHINKNSTQKNFNEIIKILSDANIKVIPTDIAQYSKYITLNNPSDHNDPSDHLIISLSLVEDLILITSDKHFKDYISQGLKLIAFKKNIKPLK